MRLPDIPHDKALHALYGALITALVLSLLLLRQASPMRAAAIALAVVAAVGALKELADRRSPAHTPELMDFLSTIAGGMLVLLPTLVGGAK